MPKKESPQKAGKNDARPSSQEDNDEQAGESSKRTRGNPAGGRKKVQAELKEHQKDAAHDLEPRSTHRRTAIGDFEESGQAEMNVGNPIQFPPLSGTQTSRQRAIAPRSKSNISNETSLPQDDGLREFVVAKTVYRAKTLEDARTLRVRERDVARWEKMDSDPVKKAQYLEHKRELSRLRRSNKGETSKSDKNRKKGKEEEEVEQGKPRERSVHNSDIPDQPSHSSSGSCDSDLNAGQPQRRGQIDPDEWLARQMQANEDRTASAAGRYEPTTRRVISAARSHESNLERSAKDEASADYSGPFRSRFLPEGFPSAFPRAPERPVSNRSPVSSSARAPLATHGGLAETSTSRPTSHPMPLAHQVSQDHTRGHQKRQKNQSSFRSRSSESQRSLVFRPSTSGTSGRGSSSSGSPGPAGVTSSRPEPTSQPVYLERHTSTREAMQTHPTINPQHSFDTRPMHAYGEPPHPMDGQYFGYSGFESPPRAHPSSQPIKRDLTPLRLSTSDSSNGSGKRPHKKQR